MARLVFDTSVLVTATNKESRYLEVKDWLRKVAEGDVTGLISAVTVSEVTEKITRVDGRKNALNAIDYLKEAGLVVMEVTEEIARLSGPLKAQFPQLSTADAIIISTAFVNKATLYTLDKGFWGIGGADVMGLDGK
jgi:predicted nucleic acid-binding protein